MFFFCLGIMMLLWKILLSLQCHPQVTTFHPVEKVEAAASTLVGACDASLHTSITHTPYHYSSTFRFPMTLLLSLKSTLIESHLSCHANIESP